MKKLFCFSQNRTSGFGILILLFLIQNLHAQTFDECDYRITVVSVKHVDCRQNGEITVKLEGDGLDEMKDILYRCYIKGEDPETTGTDWVSSTTFTSLPEYTHVVEAKAYCNKSGIYIYRTSTDIEVKRIMEYVEPKFAALASRKSFSCIGSGQIRIQGITTGQKGPFKIEIIEHPVSYTGKKILYEAETIGSSYSFDGFPAGKYKIALTTGCDNARDEDYVTIEELSSNFYASNMVYNIITTPKMQSSVNETCNHLAFRKLSQTLSTTHDHYEYFTNWQLYYDYAFYLPSEGDPKNLPENRWKSMSGATNYLIYESEHHTLKEIREEKDSRVPKVALRVKGTTDCIQSFSATLSDPQFYFTLSNVAECGKRGVNLYFYYSGNTTYQPYSVICYPYTWEIFDSAGNLAAQSATPVNTYTSVAANTVSLEPGTYKAVVTDASGYKLEKSQSVTVPLGISYSYGIKNEAGGCSSYDSIYYTIYGAAASAPLAGATIEFDRNRTNLRIPDPEHLSVTLPKDYSLAYFYPWSEDYTDRNGAYLHWKKFPYGDYAYFNVTDSCGVKSTVSITKPSTYRHREYYYTAEPKFEKEVECGWAKITPKNFDDLIKYELEGAGATVSTMSSAAFMKVVNMPAGAEVVYNTVNDYCSSGISDDCVYLSKTGTYTLRVIRDPEITNISSSYFTTLHMNYCYKDIEIYVDVPEFGMDESKSTAYRCPDNSSAGFIKITAINGSGNYLFELFDKADLQTPVMSNPTGQFDDWQGLVPANADTLVVRVTDNVCLRSFTQAIAVYDLYDANIGWVEGSARVCVGSTVRLHALSLGDEDEGIYQWFFPDGTTSNLQHPVIHNITTDKSGDITVRVKIRGCNDAYIDETVFLSVAETTMYWNPEADNANWHDSNNWLVIQTDGTIKKSNAVPAPCTTVHIAGNAKTYPNLDKDETPRTMDGRNLGYPACDTIIYHYGSETIFPNYLDYNRAKVQYNFGYYDMATGPQYESQPNYNRDQFIYPNWNLSGISLPRMERAKYYMIASPLKYVTGGDFGLSGYPHMFQKLYNTERPNSYYASHDRFTQTFSSLIQNLEKTGHAMALLAPDYYNHIGWRDHSHLEALQGVIEIPFYMENNAAIMGYHQQEYDEITSTSTFQYYDADNLGAIQKWDTYIRDYQGYRFVYENENDTVSLAIDPSGERVAVYELELKHINDDSKTNRVLIGNPLMCHIDFDMLYENNKDVIKDNFWIVDSDETFYSYRAWPGEVQENPNSITKDIPPLQGFVVEVLPEGARSKNSLTLPLEGDYSVITTISSGLGKPRTAKADTRAAKTGRKGWLSVYGVTPPINSTDQYPKDSIRIRSSVLFNYDLTDIPKIILFESSSDTKAETFFIGSDGYLNTEQVENEYPEIVRFGLESTYSNEIVLNFQIGGNLIKKAMLYDTETNARLDVTNGGYYKFMHRSGRSEIGVQGLDTERFELSLEYDMSEDGIEENNLYTSIKADRNSMKVICNEVLSSVELFDTSGIIVSKSTDINSDIYETRSINILPGMYIVKIKTANGQTHKQKILVK